MAWTYNPQQLSTSKKEQVRFKLGDTLEADGLLQDEEIAYLLEQADGDVLRASLAGCQSIIAHLSGLVDFKVGPYSEYQQNRLTAFRYLYDSLLLQVTGVQGPIAHKPETPSVFKYGMMTNGGCDHG